MLFPASGEQNGRNVLNVERQICRDLINLTAFFQNHPPTTSCQGWDDSLFDLFFFSTLFSPDAAKPCKLELDRRGEDSSLPPPPASQLIASSVKSHLTQCAERRGGATVDHRYALSLPAFPPAQRHFVSQAFFMFFFV